MEESYSFENEFETKLLAFLARKKEFWFKYSSLIQEDYFQTDVRRDVFHCVKVYYEKYSDQLTREVLENEISDFIHPRFEKLSAESKEIFVEGYKNILLDIYDNFDIDSGEDYTKDKVVEFAKRQAMRKVILSLADKVKTGKDLSNSVDEVAKVQAIGGDLDLGYDYFNELIVRTSMTYDERVFVKTGFKTLDGCLGGGLAPGELGLIVGPPSRGKTASLVNLAVGALTHRKKVIYFGLEGTKEDVAIRFDMRISQINKDSLFKEVDDVRKRVMYFQSLCKSRLVLKMFPTETASVADLDNFLSYIELVDKFVPDVILIDYLNLCKRTTKEEVWMGRNYREGKSLAVRRKVPVWSAVQAKVDSLKSKTVHPSMIAEATGRIWADADVIVALCQTPEEEEMKPMRMRFSLGKNRNREAKVSFPVKFDSIIMSMEEDNATLEGH